MPKHTENSTQTSSSARGTGSGISWNDDDDGTIENKPDDLATGCLSKSNRDTKLQVTLAEYTVSLHKIVKHTNRLIFVLQELVANDTPANCGQGKAVAKLMKKVRRFQKDLDRSTDSCDKLTELMNKYDGYRTEYYHLRNCITERQRYRHRCSSLPSMKGTSSNSMAAGPSCRSFVENPDAVMSGPPCGDGVGRKLNKRPAMLDVTKGKTVRDVDVCDSPDYVDRLCEWVSFVRGYCFICLPCQLLAYIWFN